MIPIVRLSLPSELQARMTTLAGLVRQQESDEQLSMARALWRQSSTRTTVVAKLKKILLGMAPGAERCMYCGDNQGTDIDHHEPVVRAPLRTFDWHNHMLACSYCNSHHKRDRFPVDEHGRPLLIDPSAEDPFDHLLLSLSVGEYRPLTEKGRQSIEVFGLNRPALARGRQQAFQVVVMCLRQWPGAVSGSSVYQPDLLVHIIREQPCADVCQAMLRQITMPGAAVIFRGMPEVVAALSDPRLRDELKRG